MFKLFNDLQEKMMLKSQYYYYMINSNILPDIVPNTISCKSKDYLLRELAEPLELRKGLG